MMRLLVLTNISLVSFSLSTSYGRHLKFLQVIRDEHLFLIVAAFVLLDVFLLSLWTGIEPMHTGYQQLENKVITTRIDWG